MFTYFFEILKAINFEKISYSQLIKNYCLISVLSNLPELLRETLIWKTASHTDNFNGVVQCHTMNQM